MSNDKEKKNEALMARSLLEYDFDKFKALVIKTTQNLKEMQAATQHMRWQFGSPEWYEEFVKALDDTKEGWVSSNC